MAKWACLVCTALNNPARTLCEICGSDRGSAPLIPDDDAAAPINGGGGSAPMDMSDDGGGAWNCSECTFENPASAVSCSVCGAPRRSAVSAPKSKPKPRIPSPDDPVPDMTPSGIKLNDDDKRKVRQVRAVGGCSNEHAITALMKSKGDADRALLWVVENPEILPDPEPEPAAAPSRPKPKPAASQQQSSSAPIQVVASKPKPKPQQANGLSSVAERKRRLLEAAAKRKKEKAIEDRKRAEVERQQKIEKREAKERIEAQKAHAKKVREQRAREIAAIKRKDDEKADHNRLDFAKRQEKFAAYEKKMQDDFDERRKRDEARLKTVADAVQVLTTRYGETMRNDTLRFISKIAGNIVVNTKEERFRSINAESTAFKEKVVVPLGGLVILRHLGFELSKDGTHWNLTRPDVARLKRVNEEITRVYSHKKTDIPKRLSALEQVIGAEMTYYSAEKLLEIFDNVLSLKDHSIVGKIDVNDAAFKVLVGKHPKAVAIMKQYGFRLHKSPDKLHSYMKLEGEPNLLAIRNAVGDLQEELKARFPSTPIYKVLESLKKATSSQTLDFIVPRLSKCLQRILSEPLDLQLQSVRLDKFYRKSKVPKHDAHELFAMLGFDVTPATEAKHFVAKFSEKANMEVLRSQKVCLEAAHRKLVGARR